MRHRTTTSIVTVIATIATLGAAGLMPVAAGAAGATTPVPARIGSSASLSASAPASQPINVTQLPRGGTPGAPALLGGTRLLTADGPIDVPKRVHATSVLGKAGSAYVVSSPTGQGDQFWRIGANGAARKLGEPQPVYDSSPFLAAGRIVVGDSDRGTGWSRITQLDATTGAVVQSRRGRALRPLSGSPAGVVLGRSGSATLWRGDGGLSPLAEAPGKFPTVVYADAPHHLLVWSGDQDLNVADTRTPATVRWHLPAGPAGDPPAITGFSPNGRLVALSRAAPSQRYPHTVMVRRVSDGSLVAQFTVGQPVTDGAVFDGTDGAIEFVARVGPKGAQQVVRCSLTGACTRIGGTAKPVILPETGNATL